MSISEIMADPRVRDYYLSIGASTAPVKLADDYLQSKLAGRAWECTAIEQHLRELAMIQFNSATVLDSLQAMERHKRRRKMGKGAPRMLQDIAGQVRTLYATGDYDFLPGVASESDRVRFFVRLGGDAGAGRHLKITCKASPGAVELIACKYERGLPNGFGNGRASR